MQGSPNKESTPDSKLKATKRAFDANNDENYKFSNAKTGLAWKVPNLKPNSQWKNFSGDKTKFNAKTNETTNISKTIPDRKHEGTTNTEATADDSIIDRDLSSHHRISLPKLLELNKIIEKNEDQLKIVKSMGFGSFTKVCISLLDNKLLRWLIDCYQPDQGFMDIHGYKVAITTTTVNKIFGLKSSGLMLPQIDSTYSKQGWTKYSPLLIHNGCDLNFKTLFTKLKCCSTHGVEFKVLYLMFMFACILFPRSCSTLDMRKLDYLIDLDHIHNYNWCDVILKNLEEGVLKFKTKGSVTVTGCVLLLEMAFLTEVVKTNIGYDKHIDPNIPELEQWKQAEVNELIKIFNNKGGSWNNTIWKDIMKSKNNLEDMRKDKTCENTEISYSRRYFNFLGNQIHTLNNRVTNNEMEISRLLLNEYETNICRTKCNHREEFESLGQLMRDCVSKMQNMENMMIGHDCGHTNTPGQGETRNKRKYNEQSCNDSDAYDKRNSVSNIWEEIKSNLREDNSLTAYIFSKELRNDYIIVDYTLNWNISRGNMRTLAAEEWICGEVIDVVAYMIWAEKRALGKETINWILPAMFTNLMSSPTCDYEKINRTIFVEEAHFRGPPTTCATITIPLNDTGTHWYICTIDLHKKKICISDSLGTRRVSEKRKSYIRKICRRLEEMARAWGEGDFINDGWGYTFEFVNNDSFPQQENSYDCGLYVLLMMLFPGKVDRILTEEESKITREMIGVKLFKSKENKVKRGKLYNMCVNFGNTLFTLSEFDTADINLSHTLDRIMNSYVFEGDLGNIELHHFEGKVPLEDKYIEVDNDNDLCNLVKMYSDKGDEFIKDNDIDIKLPFSPNDLMRW